MASSSLDMARKRRRQLHDYLKIAFKSKNKEAAELLLRDVGQLAVRDEGMIRSSSDYSLIQTIHVRESMVSLLHMAAYWGWYDIAVRLVTVHQCSAECKDDEEGHIPLHYAAQSGHLHCQKL